MATKVIRLRDQEHCKFVNAQPCVVCGRMPSEAHHLRFAQPRSRPKGERRVYSSGLSPHHRELHRYGDEASWWAGVNVDPLPIALDLWRRSRLTYSSAAAMSEANPPPVATVDRVPLDNGANRRD
jgi:hypothetical protein